MDVGAGWSENAPELAVWAMQNLVNRSDAWGEYGGAAYTAKGTLSLAKLEEHFCGKVVRGLHTTSVDQTCLWLGIDVDNHDPERDQTEHNKKTTQALMQWLSEKGINHLVEDSNGNGGFHVWILLSEAIDCETAWRFLQVVKGLFDVGEVFPKQAAVKPGKYGNWLRLPGRHHTRDHWSKFWDGKRWLSGADAAQHLMDHESADAALICELAQQFQPQAESNGNGAIDYGPVDAGDLESALEAIDPDDYDDWISVGMALRSDPENLFSLWNQWSSQSEKYEAKQMEKKWNSFTPDGGRTVGTIFHLAESRGWIRATPVVAASGNGEDVDLSILLGERMADAEAGTVEFPSECIEGLPEVLQLALDYSLATAIKPQPVLALGGLISLFGAVFGRKVEDDYRTRTNVMILGLAGSSAGKEHPRSVNKRLLRYAGLEEMRGPERFGSSAGIVSAVSHYPVRLFQIDEIGRLLSTMRDPRSAPHLYNIGTVLMQLYSSSNDVWTGDAYADLKKVRTINEPHVVIYGSSVPENFYESLTASNLTDGFLGRLIVFEGETGVTRRRPEKREVPEKVVEFMRAWGSLNLTTGNIGAVTGETNCLQIEKTPEADIRHEDYCDAIHSKHEQDDSVSEAIWGRTPEKAAKMALIYACCKSFVGGKPVIDLEAENWGIKLANYSTRLVLRTSSEFVSASKVEAAKKKLLRKISRDWMSLTELGRRTQWAGRKERAELIADLQATEYIEIREVKTRGRTKREVRRIGK